MPTGHHRNLDTLVDHHIEHRCIHEIVHDGTQNPESSSPTGLICKSCCASLRVVGGGGTSQRGGDRGGEVAGQVVKRLCQSKEIGWHDIVFEAGTSPGEGRGGDERT